MAFPRSPLDVRTELLIGGEWVDTIDKALVRDPVTIIRGRSNEASRPDPSKAKLSLRDQEGKWAGRNPRSPYFGLLGRNTPLRIRVGDEPVYAYAPGLPGHYLSTPDAAALDLTDVIDVRMDITPDTWRPTLSTILASKSDWHGNQDAWMVILRTTGELRFRWTTTGNVSNPLTATSTVPIPADSGRLAVRVKFDGTDAGAGGNRTVTFYTAASLDGPWSQLGTVLTGGAPSAVFSSTAPLEIGSAVAGTQGFVDTRMYHGKVHAFQLADGAGVVVADPGIGDQAEGTTGAWTGPDGRTWTAHGTTRILKPARWHGEVASWPPSWHVSGGDVHVQVQAAGIRRRLQQGATPLHSTLYRVIMASSPAPVAYWPCEVGSDAKTIAAATAGTAPIVVSGSPNMASYDDLPASEPLPAVRNSRWTATIPRYTVTGRTQVRFLLSAPSGGLTNSSVVGRLYTSGTARRWDVIYTTALAGSLEIRGYDSDGTQISSSGTLAGLNGGLWRISIELTQSGANINWEMWVARVNGPFSANSVLGTLNSRTVLAATRFQIDPNGNVDDAAIGHITVHSAISSILDIEDELAAFVGETAVARMLRLCTENGISLQVVGEPTDTAPVGPQRPATLLDLLDEAADADGGILHESRDELGFLYRTRSSMYNQAVRVTLDYTAPGEVPPPLQPVEDDQQVRNDVTATREDGSSARVVRDDGPLSVQAPPDGVDRYDEEITVNVESDEQLPHVAGWRVHLGTWDEARYPTVVMWPHKAPQHLDAIAALDVGDRFAITNPPDWLPPEDIDLHARGYTEVLKPWSWEIQFNASPAGPWDVAVVDGAVVDTSGSELAAPVTSTATSLSVATTAGPIWTTSQVRDTFTRADSASALGSADTGQAWTVNQGIWGISSNRAYNPSPPGRAVINTGLSDGAVAVTLATLPDVLDAYVQFRWASANQRWRFGLDRATATWRLEKWNSPVLTAVDTADASGAANGDRLMVSFYGSQIRAYVNGALTCEADDDFNVAATFAGLQNGSSTATRFDDFTFGSEFPIDIRVGGELMTVTAIAGATSPQTFTVIRSRNGIVKSHSAGADVRLARPAIVAL